MHTIFILCIKSHGCLYCLCTVDRYEKKNTFFRVFPPNSQLLNETTSIFFFLLIKQIYYYCVSVSVSATAWLWGGGSEDIFMELFLPFCFHMGLVLNSGHQAFEVSLFTHWVIFLALSPFLGGWTGNSGFKFWLGRLVPAPDCCDVGWEQ